MSCCVFAKLGGGEPRGKRKAGISLSFSVGMGELKRCIRIGAHSTFRVDVAAVGYR